MQTQIFHHIDDCHGSVFLSGIEKTTSTPCHQVKEEESFFGSRSETRINFEVHLWHFAHQCKMEEHQLKNKTTINWQWQY